MDFDHRHAWCPHAQGVLDVSDPCIRDAWSSAVPAVIVSGLVLYSLFNRAVKSSLLPEGFQRLFRPFLTIEEAEILEGDGGEHPGAKETAGSTPTLWRTILFAATGVLQTLIWLGLASYRFYTDSTKHPVVGGLFPLLTAYSWSYTALRPVIKPGVTPLYDLLAVYTALFCGGCLKLGGALMHSHNWEMLDWVAVGLNLAMASVVLVGLFGMPMNVPSESIEGEIVSVHVCCVLSPISLSPRERLSRPMTTPRCLDG
jgi:hypothetical protein